MNNKTCFCIDREKELEKEVADLKERLKNCLNHGSLIAARSELDKKDKRIDELEEENKTLKDNNIMLVSKLNELEDLLEDAENWVASPPWVRMQISKDITSNHGDNRAELEKANE